MTVHHEQAVQMASWARDHSSDPVVRGLAFDVEATQSGQGMAMRKIPELVRGGAALPCWADATQRAERPEVRNLAGKMLASQSSESDYLRGLLAERSAVPLPV